VPDSDNHVGLTPIHAGTMPYPEAMVLQQRLHARAVASDGVNYLLFVEHPAVLTLGKHADLAHLSLDREGYLAQGVELVQADRGGEVTAHMPGQMVVYPIIRLSSYRLSPKRYVAALEEAVIRLLAGYGIEAQRDPEFPGVWVGREKICAVGIRIKERVAMHGIALNVANDLTLFSQIVPCGISGRGVTSMGRLLKCSIDPDSLRRKFAEEFLALLCESQGTTCIRAPLQWLEGLSTI